MSVIDVTHWPKGYVTERVPCGVMLPDGNAQHGSIRLPSRYVGAGSVNYCDEKSIHCDAFGRAALETLRDSYHTMPTGNVHEFSKVFCLENYNKLASEVKRRSGYDIDGSELFENMMQAFTMSAPRTDIMDVHRRLDFSKETTQSYVDEINKLVLERAVEETKQANRLWDFYAKNRNGPSEMPDNCDIDTRTRLVSSFYAADYWMPDDDQAR
jgi:hypothetical protein